MQFNAQGLSGILDRLGGGSPQVALKGAMPPKETLKCKIGIHFAALSSRMGSTSCVLNNLHTYFVALNAR